MPQESLQQLLQKLHAELGRTRAVDRRSRQLLRRLESDILRLLDRPPPPDRAGERAPAQTDTALLPRLRESLEHLESNHPDLASAVRNLINFLENSGV